MADILSSHLASLSVPTVSKLSTFDVVEDLAGRCYELVLFDKILLPDVPAQEIINAFVGLSSEKIIITLTFDLEKEEEVVTGTRKARSVKERELLSRKQKEHVVKFTLIPEPLKRLLPYPQDSEIVVEDILSEVSKTLKLPFLGKLMVENPPSEMKIPDDAILPNSTNFGTLITDLRSQGIDEKSLRWLLLPSEEKKDSIEEEEENEDDELPLSTGFGSPLSSPRPPADPNLLKPRRSVFKLDHVDMKEVKADLEDLKDDMDKYHKSLQEKKDAAEKKKEAAEKIKQRIAKFRHRAGPATAASTGRITKSSSRLRGTPLNKAEASTVPAESKEPAPE
jgi:hypothetical protein